MTENNTMTATRSMTDYEMVEQLAAKMNITLEEARNALEAADWNTLTATHHLELEAVRRKQELNDVAASCASQTAANEETEAGQTVTADRTAGEKARRTKKHSTAFRNLWDHIRRLVAWGNRNRFVVRRNDEQLLDLPITVLVILLLCSFGTCAFLMVIGLFAGCRYSFNGKEFSTAPTA